MYSRPYRKYASIILPLCLWLLPRAALGEIQLKYFGIPSGRLAFSYTEKNKTDIYYIDFESIQILPLIATPANEDSPAWSPDGREVAFQSDASGEKQIYISHADGSNVRQITKGLGPCEAPAWSPDGKRLVFQNEKSDGSVNIFMIDTEGRNAVPVTTGQKKNTTPKWSPRGDEIIYSTNTLWPGWDLMLYNIERNTSLPMTRSYRSFFRPSWKPDGSTIAFAYGSTDDLALWTIKKGAVQPEELLKLEGRCNDPEWSDDGQRLFFVNEQTPPNGDYKLYLMDLVTNETRLLVTGEGTMRHPTWTPLPPPLPDSSASASGSPATPPVKEPEPVGPPAPSHASTDASATQQSSTGVTK
jgi:Tol biopolymer transport system component